jgi:hypothetical protein
MVIIWPERRDFGEGNDKVLVIIPHWGASKLPYNLLGAILSRDFHVRIYYYPQTLLTSDVEKTIDNISFLEEAVLDELGETTPSFIGIYGVSLGSVPAARIANVLASRNKKIPLRLVLVMSGANFPQAVWNGSSTRSIRKGLEDKGMTDREVWNKWDFLSPVNNLTFLYLRQIPILFFGSMQDYTITPINIEIMRYVLEDEYPSAAVFLNRFLGHRIGGIFNMLRIPLLRSFLLGEDGGAVCR